MPPTIRPFRVEDFSAVERITRTPGTLDLHTPYTYWAAHRVFPSLFLILENDGETSGFALGIGPNENGEVLFWQIGLISTLRGRGYAKKLALALIGKAREAGATKILVTIDEENLASRSLFTSCARASDAVLEERGVTPQFVTTFKPERAYEFSI